MRLSIQSTCESWLRAYCVYLMLAGALVLAIPELGLSVALQDTTGFRGTFWSESEDSVFTVHYDFTPYGFQPDSVAVSVAEERVIVFRRTDDSLGSTDGHDFRIKRGKLYLRGAARLDLPDNEPPPTGVTVLGYFVDRGDTTSVVEGWANLFDYFSYRAVGLELFGLSYGYFNSQLDQPLDDDGLFFGLGVAVGEVHPRWSLMVSTSWSGLGKNFAFSEPVRGEFRWFSRTHGSVIPEFAAGGGLSKIKVKRGGAELREVKWGVDVGGAIKVPFHRFSYRYSTAAGGYHTAELYIAAVEDIRSGIGTTYQFRTNGDVWTVRVSLNFSLIPMNELEPGGGLSSKIHRRDSRPLPLKLLGYGAVAPMLPFLLFQELMEL